MQDGASAHTAKEALIELQMSGIQPVLWPHFSPDLNRIETCWGWIKDL